MPRGIHQRALSWEDLKIPLSKTRLKILFSESHLDLPGANELSQITATHLKIGVAVTHWVWVMHIYVSELTSIDSDNCLSPGHHQPIIWTNAGIFLIGPLGTNFSEILIEIHTVSSKKMHLKM